MAEKEVTSKFWRISIVRNYIKAQIKKGETPENFAEIRASIILDHEPTPMELELIYKRLENSIDEIERNVYESMIVAQNPSLNKAHQVTAYSDDIKDAHEIGVTKTEAGRTPTIEVDGYEVSEVDAESIMRDFKMLKRITFNTIYNYFCLKDDNGLPIRQTERSDDYIKTEFLNKIREKTFTEGEM